MILLILNCFILILFCSYPNDKSVGKVLSNVVGFILFFGGFGISYALYCNDLKWFSAFIFSALFILMAHMIPIMSSHRWSFIFSELGTLITVIGLVSTFSGEYENIVTFISLVGYFVYVIIGFISLNCGNSKNN